MDSINRNQPEQNREDLSAGKAVDKIKDIVKDAETCFFCTAVATSASGGARPMNVRQVDDQGTLWFLSANDSHKNAEITANPSVTLYFQESAHAGFLQLTGNAAITTDKAKIKELWEPILKTWFTEGEDDPRLTAISVVPSDGYYWDTKHGMAVASVKMLVGAVVGKTLDDSIEGTISV